ncbi:phosphatidylinositol transporter [Starmerella bacillaris]|uniref:SEC14 homolog 3 n=1 Tax=Starmerella bacillaris TaxID=1247836 RepID=A0AAV5RDY3_STABA|nr:phosphatidylinositol transporter [Starmerella bacillaris]
MSEIRETIFSSPPEQSKVPAPKKLSEKEQKDYDYVLNYLLNLKALPVAEKNSKTEPLSETEKAWLSKECIFRYLRASKWDVKNAIKRLEETLVWRRTFGVDPNSSLPADLVEVENETGKEVILGYDIDCRPCLYLKPGKQNTKSSHRQVQHLVFMLERVIDLMVPGQDSLCLLIDFKNGSKLPSLGVGREVLNILQNHYPERLGRSLLVNIPRLGWLFLKLINPFIDPMTKEKLIFQEPCKEYVPPVQLDKEFGGSCEFKYNHKVYWPDMCKTALSRHEAYFKKYQELGGGIGLSEYEIREQIL